MNSSHASLLEMIDVYRDLVGAPVGGLMQRLTKRYARREGDVVVHANTIESVFSALKRGMAGIYQHCSEAHLHRYLAEFDFRYNRRATLKISDAERAKGLLRGARDKRLTYRRFNESSYA